MVYVIFMDGIGQATHFFQGHRITEHEKIRHGYKDGGRFVTFSPDGVAQGNMNREILVFRGAGEDPILWSFIENIKMQTHGMTIAQKAKHLYEQLRAAMPERNPQKNDERMQAMVSHGHLAGTEFLLGDVLATKSAVCRHYSLMFKIAADQIDVPAALVRGNFISESGRGGHAWNEVVLEDGNRILMDVMNGAGCDLYNPYATYYATTKNEYMYDKRVLERAPWLDVTDRYGRPSLYIDTEALPDDHKKSLEIIFERHGIEYQERETTLNSGMTVIAINGGAIQKLRQVMGVERKVQSSRSRRHHVSNTMP